MDRVDDEFGLLSEQSNSLPVALHYRYHALQRISNLKHHYTGAISRRLPTRFSNAISKATWITCRHRYQKFSKLDSALFWLMMTLMAVYFVYRSGRLASFTIKVRLMWHSLVASTGGGGHQERITNFYKDQASVYDETRKDLLKGRRTMLRLAAAHMLESRKSNNGERLVWVDVGGGTGYNIEAMGAFLPVNSFDAVYLVDICAPLLDVARKRFASRGWTNVHTIHQDAASFTLPEERSISLVTFSYSLSMIPDFYAVLDRISKLLSPNGGILSVVDFYTSGNIFQSQPSAADVNRACGRLSRWFWQIWFDFDNVMVGSQRREYLEHRFETLKAFNSRNKYMLPSLIQIPYYIWLGKSRPNATCTANHLVSKGAAATHEDHSRALFRNSPWRIPYSPKPWNVVMNTFIYSFTWEDPFEDMKYLDPGETDSLLVITSAGDNALHYAVDARFKTIHCVDMNPCQGHLLELKMAALKMLPYETIFAMFGYGHIDSFQEILDLELSPSLSAPCYQFWKANANMFASSLPLYMHGFSGFALRIVRTLFSISGRSEDVQQLCRSSSTKEQNRIWIDRIRPVILNPLVVSLLNNRWFCWRALGVPENQRNMLLAEGTAYDYVRDTLDPVVESKLLSGGAYHYVMTLLGQYTPSSCPLYLTRSAFDALKANNGELMDPIKIHTDKISGVLKTMPESSLSRAILMDHLDWFSENDLEADEEIELLYSVLKPGGFILLRSAGRAPWYIERFVSMGFDVMCLNVRKPSRKEALDSVNMYASFWKIIKPVNRT